MRESYYSYRGLLVDYVDEYLGIIFVASTSRIYNTWIEWLKRLKLFIHEKNDFAKIIAKNFI